MDGYPPTVALTVSVARDYGLASIVANKSWLTDFQIRTFAPLLERMSLEDEEWEILRVLANEESLPIGALAAARGYTEEEISSRLWKLTDLSLILPRDDVFELASPVRQAVFAARGWLSDEELGVIADNLRSTYWKDPSVLPSMHIIAATIHAVSRSRPSELQEFSDIILPSSLFRAAKEQYDQGGTEAWEAARDLAQKVLEVDPNHKKARILLCKVFVRLNDWQRAEGVLQDIRTAGYVEQYYMAGFIQWKRGKLSKAVTEFRAALAANDRGAAVYHGLGTCLFRLGNVDDARSAIEQGLRGRRPNPLLLDLAALVAIALGEYNKAEEYVDQLQRLGERIDYHHRMSTLLSARQEFQAALPHAENACDQRNPRFECLANRINVRIELEDYGKAEQELDDLDRRFRTGWDKHDVRAGLRSKLLLKQGKWKQAEHYVSQSNDKDSPFYLGLRTEVLRQKVADVNVSPGERALAKEEIERISAMDVGRASWLTTAIYVGAREGDVG